MKRFNRVKLHKKFISEIRSQFIKKSRNYSEAKKNENVQQKACLARKNVLPCKVDA